MSSERNWLALILLLGVGVPVGTWLAVPDARKYVIAGEGGAEPVASKGKAKRDDQKKDAKKPKTADALDALFARGEEQASFLFASLPDPRESLSPRGFDEQLAALRRALETAGYSKFDSWDPWFDPDGEVDDRPWRTLPGLMFFRRENDRPLGVFIIGETPTRGIHEQALVKALDLWGRSGFDPTSRQARFPRAYDELRMLGPSSSGATRSLADTLAAWKKRNAWFKGPMRAISGSATDVANADLMAKAGVTFDATVHDDDALQAFVSYYLQQRLHIGSDAIAILTESSSSYGQGFAGQKGAEKKRAAGSEAQWLALRYPPYLRSLRQSYARTRGTKTVPGAASVLEIEADDDLSGDLFEPHAAPSRAMAELSLNRVIEAIAAERIRAVEIVALDPQDAAFLATRVRESFPTVTVVILSSDVLYLHRDYQVIDGLLVASTYPLANRSQRTTYPFSGISARHSFPSEQAEGTFNAALILLDLPHLLVDYGPPLRLQAEGQAPALWMSVVSNGEIWPVDVQTRDDLVRIGVLDRVKPQKSYVHVVKDPGTKKVPSEAWRATRGVGFYAFVALFSILSVAAIGCYAWARKLGDDARDASAPLLVRVLGNLPGHQHEVVRRVFMTVLLLVLAVLWSFVAVVQSAATHRPSESLQAAPLIKVTGYLVIATQVLAIAAFVFSLARIPPLSSLKKKLDGRYLPAIGRFVLLAVSIAIAIGIVARTQSSLDGWLTTCGFAADLIGPVDQPQCQRFLLFLDRARALNSGLSLIVTLFVLAVGYFVWYGAHLYKAWHTNGFRPLRKRPLFARAPDHLRAVARAAETTLRRFESVLPAIGLVVPTAVFLGVAYLRASAVPFFESPSYHWWIAVFYSLFLMLLVYGCGRSLQLWWNFRMLLQKLATVPGLRCPGDDTHDLLLYVREPWGANVAQAWLNASQRLSEDVHDLLAAAVAPDGRTDKGGWRRLLVAEEAGVSKPADEKLAEAWATIRGLRVWALVDYLRQHLLNVLRATSVGLLLLLVVVSMYPFKGERLLLGMVLTLGLITTTTVFLIFLRLRNDYVLARLGGTTDKGKKEGGGWDPTFIRGVVLHAVLPLLGILALRFPEVGGFLSSLSGPLGGLLGK